MKNIFIFFLFAPLFADITIPNTTKQLLVVHTVDFNRSKAIMQAYEYKSTQWMKVFEPISVNLGKNGLAWGRGKLSLQKHKGSVLKKEGDNKAPAGLFSLDLFFAYEEQDLRLWVQKLSSIVYFYIHRLELWL
ncbi:hypothetical protein JHD50_11770 [Sulfurimonas sp. MAG313]|nr:hypothetical protein [Sulfurimonas sp. MAG313]MDF1881966.1 hypothetical protein [Sulfurimonas sp. MAG313]